MGRDRAPAPKILPLEGPNDINDARNARHSQQRQPN